MLMEGVNIYVSLQVETKLYQRDIYNFFVSYGLIRVQLK